MAEITAAMVKALRESTGQGMMECKKALQETNGDAQAAVDLLRSRGKVKAEKKAARATSEGLVEMVVAKDGSSVTMVEVVCETDFCARNEEFRTMVADVAATAAGMPAGDIAATDAINTRVQQAFEKIGENMRYTRGAKLAGATVGSYKHHNNKVGVIVALDGKLDPTTVSELCMHIAFHNPMGVSADDIPAEVIEHEKVVAKAQAMEEGKPEAIAEKMVVGKVRKFCEQNCLLEQPFIKDETRTVKEVLGGVKVVGFVRYEVGGATEPTEA
ncbi:MAG: translation elongation factor Ts [Planctomycetes bacterium]|nr:translation elongation factor Ts [Planctomycetota bacterium]